MIAYLRGPILRRTDEVVVVEAGGIGYEVHLPAVVARALPRPADGEPQVVELHISYHATQNQPKPLLIGFLHEVEQEFFERFITVDGMGPTKAMKAIVHPIHVIADAIERKDTQFLRRLPGIGERTAEKVIATLHGKMGKYALLLGTDILENFRRVSLDFRARKVRFQLRRCSTEGVILSTNPDNFSRLSAAEGTEACSK